MMTATQGDRVLTVTLPYPPSVNHLFPTVNGRRVKSAEGRVYHERIANRVWMVRRASHWSVDGALRVDLEVCPPDARRRDLDNVLKALGDGLCKGLGVDDSTIAEWHIYRRPARRPDGEVVVTVTSRSEQEHG